jgi:hypothetical protein
MPTDTTPVAPSGLRIREILTQTITETVDGVAVPRVVPALDKNGQEIEVYSIPIPQHVEAEGADAVTAHLADVKSRLNLQAPEVVGIAPVVETAPNPPTEHEGAES